MTRVTSIIAIGLVGMAGLIGCSSTPAPPRVPVPSSYNPQAPMTRSEPMKPLPPDRPTAYDTAPPFDDVPLISQEMPEQRAFVEAYRKVGSPRIVLFVNRTLEGSIIPVNVNDPLISVERTQRSTAGVNVQRSDTNTRDPRYRTGTDRRSDSFSSQGPAEYRDTTDVYLRPGQYDEVAAKSLDYEAIENIMTDWLACDGQVTIISPIMARQRLTEQQVKELQEGRPQVMGEIVRQLGADIFVQVQAHPTRQTLNGLEVRIVCQALNVKGGESIARSVVDVIPPLEKTTMNRYTRFLARDVMKDMLGTWSAPPPAPAVAPMAPISPPPPPAPSAPMSPPAPAEAAPAAP